jgi:F-type H+-transporting ATPase subunit b
MDETLRQIGELLLGSIPTVVLFLLLYGVYRLLVHQPLTRVLAQRRERTQGAIERARSEVSSAEGRTAEYERRLREARLEMLKAQEARRAKAAQERAQRLAEARNSAQAEVEKAQAHLEQDKQAAKVSLEQEAARLATEIIRTALEPAFEQSPAGGR